MDLTAIINTELRKRKKSPKWLYEQLFIVIPGKVGDFQSFEFRLMENKLTAIELLYVSAILSVDFQSLAGIAKSIWRLKEKEDLAAKERILRSSKFQGDGLERWFHRKNIIIYLVTTSVSECFVALEEYLNGDLNTMAIHNGVDESITTLDKEILFELLMEGLNTKQIRDFT